MSGKGWAGGKVPDFLLLVPRHVCVTTHQADGTSAPVNPQACLPSQVLTLASNERIPLNRTMRLVFEISHLRTATPATVSRAGILYINPADLGWNP